MHRYLIQAIAVLAIALGAGLFAFGRYLDPRLDATNTMAVQRPMDADEETYIAASTSGAGVGLMTFGTLGVVLPWINEALARRRALQGELTA